jgi:hypothetical protein
LQAKHRQFLAADREQDVVLEDQGDRNVARFLTGVEQEVRVQVGMPLLVHVEAGAGFEVGQVAGVGQIDVEQLADPGANLLRRGHQVYPDRA